MILKDLKPSGQVAQVLSQILTSFWTELSQLVPEKVSMTKADPLAVRLAMMAMVEVIERCILEKGEILEIGIVVLGMEGEAVCL